MANPESDPARAGGDPDRFSVVRDAMFGLAYDEYVYMYHIYASERSELVLDPRRGAPYGLGRRRITWR
jgi:hypothetical protein